MEKILLNLIIPALQKDYDVFIPGDMDISSLIQVVNESVIALSGRRYCPSGYELLLHRERQALLNPKYTLFDYDVKDGEHLVLL